MVIEYDTTTFEIRAIHYGRVYNASDWSGYDVSGQAIAKSDEDQDCYNKYAIIAGDGITFTTGNISKFSISQSKTEISANDTDYCDFTGVPQGTTITIDGASGTLRFKAIHAGNYQITFTKQHYVRLSMSVEANDGYLYDNITG
jgi:hypothetical protein